jgi:hypothetical protein
VTLIDNGSCEGAIQTDQSLVTTTKADLSVAITEYANYAESYVVEYRDVYGHTPPFGLAAGDVPTVAMLLSVK